MRFMPDGSSSHYLIGHRSPASAETYYFPPAPPALDDELQVLPPRQVGKTAPREAAPFVGELFYPMLADHLANEGLSAGSRDELADYRAARADLRRELSDAVAALADVPAVDRGARLRALGETQHPRLLALEAAAEKLRTSLGRTDVAGQVF